MQNGICEALNGRLRVLTRGLFMGYRDLSA
jgi:hypothetical protein